MSGVRSGVRVVETAAKTAAAKMPADKLEDAVVTGVREVGRAIESVATTLQREVLGSDRHEPAGAAPEASSPEGAPTAASVGAAAPSAPVGGVPSAVATEVAPAPQASPETPAAPAASAAPQAAPHVPHGAPPAPSADNPHEGL